MDWKQASIEWLTQEEGGRKQPPTGEEPPVYWAVVKLLDVEPQSNSWSMYVRKEASSDDGHKWDAVVKFRVDEAPHHLLSDNVRFELYEGPKRVANGIIHCDASEPAGKQPQPKYDGHNPAEPK